MEVLRELYHSLQQSGLRVHWREEAQQLLLETQLNGQRQAVQLMLREQAGLAYWQFLLALPLGEVQAEFQGPVSQTLMTLNRFCPIGSLGLTKSQRVFLRQTQVGAEPEPLVVQEIVDKMSFSVERLGALIEAVMQGQLSPQQVEAQLEGKFQQGAPDVA